MKTPHNHTRIISNISASAFSLDDSTFVFARTGTEERVQSQKWQEIEGNGAHCLAVTEQSEEYFAYEFAGESHSKDLLEMASLMQMLPSTESIYIDVSGLAHHVWAPLLRAALGKYNLVYVVYTEPKDYKPNPSPTSPNDFDLSVDFRGIIPIPGFAQLNDPMDPTKTVLVALLGFEGRRPSYIFSNVDWVKKVIPVVGVPGFRIEYPSFTVGCNISFLDESRSHSEIRFAKASCPFGAIDVLEEIRRDYPGFHMYIAPVGTKPHAVGAVKFAIDNPGSTELLYDNPVRKPGRTDGVGITHVYRIKG